MIHLDKRDIEILKILSAEGRITKAELAERIHLSATPCWERLKRLEKAGIIRAYRAEVSLKDVVGHVAIFVTVELERHRADDMASFEQVIQTLPECVGCWALGGGFDYLLQIVTSDIDSYQRLMDDLLARRVGLARYFTYVVTKQVKSGGVLPLDLLLGATAKE